MNNMSNNFVTLKFEDNDLVGFFFVWWHINFRGVFNAKAITVEEEW